MFVFFLDWHFSIGNKIYLTNRLLYLYEIYILCKQAVFFTESILYFTQDITIYFFLSLFWKFHFIMLVQKNCIFFCKYMNDMIMLGNLSINSNILKVFEFFCLVKWYNYSATTFVEGGISLYSSNVKTFLTIYIVNPALIRSLRHTLVIFET